MHFLNYFQTYGELRASEISPASFRREQETAGHGTEASSRFPQVSGSGNEHLEARNHEALQTARGFSSVSIFLCTLISTHTYIITLYNLILSVSNVIL